MPTGSASYPTQRSRPRLLGAYPQLFVADVRRAADFYANQLGFTVEYLYGEPPFYGEVARDNARLNLRHADTPVVDQALREREVLLDANIPVDDVATLFWEFQGRGVPFAQKLTVQPWGTTDFIVRDPDGNFLCFAGAPGQEASGGSR